jgi:hypothetical protein
MNTKQHKSDGSEKTERPLSEQQRIFTLLQTTANVLGKELQPDELELWQRVLLPCPLRAIEFAFEDISRNCKFFPRPSDVLDLVAVYHQSAVHAGEWKSCGRCEQSWVKVDRGRTSRQYYDSSKKSFVRDQTGGNPVDPQLGAVVRCSCFRSDQMMAMPFYEHYGQGYGVNDIKALLVLHEQARRRLPRELWLDESAQNALEQDLDARRKKHIDARNLKPEMLKM